MSVSFPALATPASEGSLADLVVQPTFIEISGAGHKSVRFYAYWLWSQLQAGRTNQLGVDVSHWTDGANFAVNFAGFPDAQVRIRSAALVEQAGVSAIVIRWDDDAASESVCSLQQLFQCAQPDPLNLLAPTLWDANHDFLTGAFTYDAVMHSDGALFRFLHYYLTYGMVFVSDVPPDVDALGRVADRISTLQPTHLGAFFEVRPSAKPTHIGEVNAGVPLHIDLVYKQHPPEIQLLHVLKQSRSGGANIFTDGLLAASQLPERQRLLLQSQPVWFVADSNTVHFRGTHTVIQAEASQFKGVKLNHHKIVFPPTATPAYFSAYNHFQSFVHSPALLNQIKLPEDSIVVFSNERVLHGRQSFEGDRHFRGCFVCADDLHSKYRRLFTAYGQSPPVAA